jgi:methionine sulfoxide reductase heme-binding subunit
LATIPEVIASVYRARMPANERFGRWALVGTTGVVLAVACATIALTMGAGEAAIRLVIRLTARCSAVLFSLAFAASAINRLWHGPVGRWLLRNRRYLGLSFAVSHAYHLAALVALGQVRGDPYLLAESQLAGVLGGGFGYLMLAALTATSSDAAVAWMGRRRWKALHTFGMYVLAVIFVFTFAGAAVETGSLVRLAFAALVLLAFALRLAAGLAHRLRTRGGQTG